MALLGRFQECAVKMESLTGMEANCSAARVAALHCHFVLQTLAEEIGGNNCHYVGVF